MRPAASLRSTCRKRWTRCSGQTPRSAPPAGNTSTFTTAAPPPATPVPPALAPAGNTSTLSNGQQGGAGDHFVIGNGDGCLDGEIQLGQRWNKQLAAVPPAGAQMSEPDSIVSICLVGDFDRSVPTPTQLQRLSQLVTSLQGRLHIRG